MRRIGRLMVVMAGAGIAAAPAHATCWANEDVNAAKVRDLQTGLQIAATLCQDAGFGGVSDYRSFANAGRRALATADKRLKTRFMTLYGVEGGRHHYDGFIAILERDYAGQPMAAESCAAMAAVTREGARVGNQVSGLVAIADRIGVVPRLPEAQCPVTLAARAIAAGP